VRMVPVCTMSGQSGNACKTLSGGNPADFYMDSITPGVSESKADYFAELYEQGGGQGLTLVHFSAQTEPFLAQNTPSTPPDTS
jgi:hypothetical protein